MSSRMPRIVSRRPAFDGWNKVEILTVEAEDRHGAVQRLDREVVDHGNASVVLTVDPERRVAILVRQWRAPLIEGADDPYLLEVCAGIIDPGESPEVAARREAEEEIGLKIREIRNVGTVVPSPGTLTEWMHLFIAEVSSSDRTHSGGGKPGEGEDIEVVEVPLADLYRMARDGEIPDAKTLLLVQRLMIEELQAAQRG